MITIMAVATGGAIGAVLRYGVTVWSASITDFPIATLIVNIVGSFIMGLCAGVLPETLSIPVRTFVMTGVLGAFTTFSAFSLDFVTLIERGQTLQSITYLTCNVFGSILALVIGLYIARTLLS